MLDLPNIGIYLVGYWLLLVTIAAVEMVWPMHIAPYEPKGRLLTNFGMGLFNVSAFALIPVSIVAAAQWAHAADFGLLNLVPLPWPAAAALTVAIRSLAAYWLHRASHASGLLWRFHRVHHCDVAIDLSTGFRTHPIEALIVMVAMMGVAIFFGLAPVPLAAFELVVAASALWTHANLGIASRAERMLRTLVVTPDMHHVHHSAVRNQTDSNYGDIFSVWDRLFGTYRALDRDALRAVRFGLGEADDRHASSFTRQLQAPLRQEAHARSIGG